MNLVTWFLFSFAIKGVLGRIDMDFVNDFLGTQNVNLNFVTCCNSGVRLQIMTENCNSYKPKRIRFLKTVEDLTFDDYLIIDFECEHARMFVEKMNQPRNTTHLLRKRQILLFVDENYTNLSSNLKFSNGLNNIIIAREIEGGFQLLKPAADTSYELQHYGIWDIANGTTLFRRPKKSCNFNGRQFDIAMVLSDTSSLLHLEDYSFPWIDIYTKQSFITLMRLFDYCNITPKFVRVPDYRHLYDKNYPFLLTASSPYLSREVVQNVDVLYVQNGPKICYLMRRPPTSFMTTIFTDALTANVWWATLATLGLLCVCYYFILNLEGRRQEIKYQEEFTVIDLGLIAFEAICQQGTTVDPKSYSARILAVIMFLAFMFLYVSYSANILILLQSTTAISDTEELHGLSVKYGGMNTQDFLQYNNNNEDHGRKIYSIDNAPLYSIPDGMEKLKDGLFAYYVESPYAYKYAVEKYTDYEICALHEIGGYIDKNLGYINVPKNSQYREILKVTLLLMAELGFQSRDYQRFFYKPTCFARGSSFDSVGLAETHQIMYLIILGILTSLTILGLEYLGNKLIKRVKNKLNMQLLHFKNNANDTDF